MAGVYHLDLNRAAVGAGLQQVGLRGIQPRPELMVSRVQRTLVCGHRFAVQVADFQPDIRCLRQIENEISHAVERVRHILEKPHAFAGLSDFPDAGLSDEKGRVGVVEHLLPMFGGVLHQNPIQLHILAVLVMPGEPQGHLVLRTS